MFGEGQRLGWPRLRRRWPKKMREKEFSVCFKQQNLLAFKGPSNEMKPWGSGSLLNYVFKDVYCVCSCENGILEPLANRPANRDAHCETGPLGD